MNGNLAYDWDVAERAPSDFSNGSRVSAPPSPWQDSRPSHITIAPSRLQRRARPRLVYALIAAGGIFVIICGQLLLSVAMSQAAYEITALESEATALSRTWQSLTVELDAVASPQNLAAQAEALGMVRNTNPSVFLRLSDGAVLGLPAPAIATAGSVIGAGEMVPNSLLKKKDAQVEKAQAAAQSIQAGTVQSGATQPGLTQPGAAPASTRQAAIIGAAQPQTQNQLAGPAADQLIPRAPGANSVESLVPLQGGLPAPKTH